MTEHVNPFDYIPEQSYSKNLEIALEDPSNINYRSNPDDKVEVKPEDPSIMFAEVDRANRNVDIQYDLQKMDEKYVVVMKGTGVGIIESLKYSSSSMSGQPETVLYHVVTPDMNLMYDDEGYVESLNDFPRQAAQKAPELLEKAEELGESGSKPASELEPSKEQTPPTRPIPPPQKDPLFDD